MRSWIRWPVVAVTAVACALFVACGDDGTTDTPAGDPGTIDGEYVAGDVLEAGEPKDLVEGTTIRLRLQDGQLSASAGCNHIGGRFTVDDGTLHVDALAMTDMGCDAARHEQDEWLAALLSSAPTVEPLDDGLVLRSGYVEIMFVDRSTVDPERDLVATTWTVDSYVTGTGSDGTVSSATGDDARVTFDANGYVTGHDGCNEFGYGGPASQEPTDGLRYVVDGDRIVFSGAAVTTARACPDVDTDRFWAVLEGTVTWDVDGSLLTLFDETGHGVLYRAAT
jgi:heat shock protein HslJ